MHRSLIVAALLIPIAGVGCKSIVKASLEPDEPFEAAVSPAAPDYSNPDHWAALPTRQDQADVTPAGETNRQETAEVDVFFVHPTTYFSGSSWNAPLDDEKTNDRTDSGPLRHQASAFNSTGKIYAPRYRQATFGAFTTDALAERNKALDFAYGDVLAAFDYFIEHHNDGRPFIIASHSQGSQHASRLLQDRMNNEILRERLVAAYVIGTPISDEVLPDIAGIPRCEGPQQTGCLVNYNTIAPEADRSRFYEKAYTYLPGRGYVSNEGKDLICVNPISWRADEKIAPKSQHRGAVNFRESEKPEPDVRYVSAACDDGLLEATPTTDEYDFLLGRRGDYHMVDYALFYIDIRRNAELRAQTFLANRKTEDP